MRFTTVLAAGLIAAATALSPVGEGALAQTPRDTVVMAKQIDDIVSLDPAESFEASGGEVIGNVYDRLLSFDVKDPSKLQGELAASWSVSADGKTLTFKIRPGVKFASGNQVTAQDVAYSFQRTVALNKSPAFIITQFGLTKDNVAQRARAVDDSTFVLEIDKPFAPTFVLNCLTSAPASIVDAKLVKANEKDGDWGNAWLKQNSAGSGAYTLRVYRAGEQYTLDAHAGWYKGASKNRRVVVRHVPEPASQRLLIEKGDVDLARSLTKDQVEALRGSANVVIDSGVKGYLLYLGLNQKHPILSKPEVREALKLLVDYDAIERNILAGTYIQQQAFLPQGLFGAIKDRPYRFDVAKAKELLAKAGHPNGFAITMDVRSVSPITEVAQAIQASWGQAGVKMEILPGDGRQVLTKYRARNHEVFIGRWGIDYPDPHTNAEQFAMNEDNSEN
ncbi:MAG: ABC transporter substrate-binding protein, partial [Alphaproteobacteria bacterium]|nr:ABC transporter substrate-binding protein [Alphaproteobacteria bacterium]